MASDRQRMLLSTLRWRGSRSHRGSLAPNVMCAEFEKTLVNEMIKRLKAAGSLLIELEFRAKTQ